jgi:diguanylate cyclase (GGDEF)-like protein/PAS domain S-box-containing protein
MELDGGQYKMIVENSPNLLWRAGTDGLCNYFNTRWLQFTGRTMQQEMGNGWAEGVHPEDMERCVNTYMKAFAQREPFEMVYRLKRFDGDYRWINDRGVPFFDDAGIFMGYIGSCMDITEKVLGERLREMAQTDGLTGINNRQYFEQMAAVEVEKAKRYKKNLCVVMADIDCFKKINDEKGHPAGDRILQDFAANLQASIREFDILGRYGGDEFVILLPDTNKAEAKAVLKRVKGQMRSQNRPDEKAVAITFSAGISEMKTDDTLYSLEERADREMYRIKKNKTKEEAACDF